MNLVLIGMSGAGKSTLGVLLAKALGMDFVDTDLAIQQQESRLLQDIMDREGIARFMLIEEQVVSELAVYDSVISTGGSVVYSEKAMLALKQRGRIVYLHVPFDEIKQRLHNITSRGIVMKQGQSLKDVYEERVPLYRKYSDVTVDCSDKDIEQCVKDVMKIRLST